MDGRRHGLFFVVVADVMKGMGWYGMGQLNNRVEIHFMDVYRPSEEEQKDPVLYSLNVRRLMAMDLGVTPTDHSFDDVLLQMEVSRYERGRPRGL